MVSDSTIVAEPEMMEAYNDSSKTEIIPKVEVDNEDEKDSSKPSIQQQVKQKAVEETTEEETSHNGLTPIKKEDSNVSESKQKLTPINDKLKQDKTDNPISPNNPKRDNKENPINNPQ